MKTIYSILYITLNTALNERVSIGLLMSNGEHNIFKHSSDKLLALKGLVDTERYNLVKSYLKSLENDINLPGAPNQLFNSESIKSNWITKSYMSYLSKYSNNSIQFSEPKHIDIEFSATNFNKIFEKYIYTLSETIEYPTAESILIKIKTKLYPKIEDRVNIDISLTSSHFENLFAPIEVNFIGLNGIPVAGQTIDFEKKHYNLENDVTRYVSLTKAIELEDRYLEDGDKGKYFVIGREPEIKSDKNHSLWEQIRDSDFLEFIDIDEIGIVEEYIKKNDVRPYFSE